MCVCVREREKLVCQGFTGCQQGVPGECRRLAPTATETFLLSCDVDLGRQVDVPALYRGGRYRFSSEKDPMLGLHICASVSRFVTAGFRSAGAGHVHWSPAHHEQGTAHPLHVLMQFRTLQCALGRTCHSDQAERLNHKPGKPTQLKRIKQLRSV